MECDPCCKKENQIENTPDSFPHPFLEAHLLWPWRKNLIGNPNQDTSPRQRLKPHSSDSILPPLPHLLSLKKLYLDPASKKRKETWRKEQNFTLVILSFP
jgi:hypothetical protein